MKKTILALLTGIFVAAGAQAAYPDKPVTIIVPFPPGGSTDMLARIMTPKMAEKLGQPVVVENKPGATGAIGATQVKRSAPDGYTLLCASIGVWAVNPFLQKNLAYDPAKDFDLMTVAVRAPNVLVVNPSVPAKDVKELIAYLKQRPNKVTFASSGAGSSDHLSIALFWMTTGTNGIHVPYKGGGPAIADLVAGHAEASFQNLNVMTGHIKAGLNYAMSLHAIVDAHKQGFDENMYLDPKTRTKVEETGGANFIFVTKDGKVVTPKSDSILPSITRRSLIYVAKEYLGLEAEEREVYFDEVKDFAECGLCGTAAVISPVGKINDHGKEICFPSGMEKMGPVIQKLYDTLTGIQMGRIEAPKGWIHVIE